MNWLRARSRRAPRPHWTAKRAPEIFAARSKSRIPSSGPRSQWAFGSKSKAGGSPTFRTSTLADSSGPTGTSGSGMLGTTRRKPRRRSSTSCRRASPSLIRAATPFISALRSEASSFALPRRAISSPTLRLLVAQLLDLLDELAALAVEGPGVDALESGPGLDLLEASPAGGEHLEHRLTVLHDELQIEHGEGRG